MILKIHHHRGEPMSAADAAGLWEENAEAWTSIGMR